MQLSLWEAVSQGQWMHPISSSPCCIWFNRERRGPQTELWESVQQQCGQVVNTQTWRGRAGLQTGLISPGLSSPADRGGGEGEEAGEWWFGLLLFTPLPSTTSLLPAALSFGLSGYNWKSGTERNTTMKQETDKQADKCTWRLKSRKTAETHQFVNSTIFNRVITLPPPCLTLSLFLWLHCSLFWSQWKRSYTNFFIQNGQRRAQTIFNAKQIKLNSLLSFLFSNESKACFNSSEIEFHLSLSSCNIILFVHILLV